MINHAVCKWLPSYFCSDLISHMDIYELSEELVETWMNQPHFCQRMDHGFPILLIFVIFVTAYGYWIGLTDLANPGTWVWTQIRQLPVYTGKLHSTKLLNDNLHPFPNQPLFLLVLQYKSFEQTVGKGELLVTNNFSFSQSLLITL